MNKHVSIAALICGTAVALSAFGAHALKPMLSEYHLNIFNLAADYQFKHGLALLLLAIISEKYSDHARAHTKAPMKNPLTAVRYLFYLGIVFFSGSLYLLALTGVGKWGMVTPLGGGFLIGAWGWWALLFQSND